MKVIPHRISRLLRQQRNVFRFRTAGKDVRVEFNNSQIGMFAQFNFCLYMALLAQRTGQRLHIDLTSDNYRDPEHGPNWFDYFLVLRHGLEAKPERSHVVLSDNSEMPPQHAVLTIERAHETFFSTYSLRPALVEDVNEIVQRLNIGKHTLGVHFRATDKHSEAELVEASTAVEKIATLVRMRPDIENIFVASDVAGFPELVESRLLGLPVVYLADSKRSTDDTPVHLGGLRAGNYAMGRDAILNSLTLARCGVLLRTTSFLSAWSSVFSPEIPVFLLNVPFDEKLWFPEKAIVPRATVL